MRKEKFYVVWVGVAPGIYTSWRDCLLQVKGYEGAKYKAFDSREEAERAVNASPEEYIASKTASKTAIKATVKTTAQPATALKAAPTLPPAVEAESLAVDAACSGNPGQMEYRGIYLAAPREIFHFGPVYGTNNIGEFLAIVHALALLKQKGLQMPVYSDSANAISWVRQKKCKTKLPRDGRTESLFQLIDRAEKWLAQNSYTVPLLKWNTKQWGEIPADFGRK
ncbi:MAG: ribonuclease H family protein [Prevotellaceae bacterium]|nr:ribonuclease H family protein [Prevotellaceae bacterium]